MKRREKGLTLIELMVTLAVAIVLLAIGIPAFNAMSARDMSAAAVNALVTALQTARVEAVGRGSFTAVCATADKATPDTCGSDQTWNTGWLVFAEPDSPNGSRGAGDIVVKRFEGPRPEVAVTAPSGLGAIQFSNTGRAVAATTMPVTLTVRAYKNSGHQLADCVRQTDVIVSAVGQVRSDVKATCQ